MSGTHYHSTQDSGFGRTLASARALCLPSSNVQVFQIRRDLEVGIPEYDIWKIRVDVDGSVELLAYGYRKSEVLRNRGRVTQKSGNSKAEYLRDFEVTRESSR